MRSRGCWDAPGAVEEGVAQRGEDGDVVRPGGGDVGTDAAEGLEPAHAPPAPADLRLELGHSDGLFAAVVGPVDVEVGGEVQHLVDPPGHPVGQLVGLLAGAFDARGVGGDALLGGVGVEISQRGQGARRQADRPGVDRGVDRPARLGQGLAHLRRPGLALRVGFPDRLQVAHQVRAAQLDPGHLPAPAGVAVFVVAGPVVADEHAATDGFGILPRFAGVLVRDDWAGYHKYRDPGRGGKVTGVQLCCAHLLRDLQAVWEADPQGQAWAAQMRQTLTKARQAVDAAIDAGAVSLPPGTLAALRDLYANTAEQGVAANAPGVKGRSKEAYKLANRMARRIDQVLYFSSHLYVDWTNNSCEQTIRMAKLQAKISGSWRSMRGLKAFCRIRSYIATARAHDVPVFTALRDAFLDSPWSIPATA